MAARGEPVTFNKNIAPLVYRSCVPCHRPSGAAPFSLLRYEDVRKHAGQIVAVTKSRYMPPWLPEPGSLRFADNARLAPAEIALLDRWAKEGLTQGDGRDLPTPPQFASGWQLGEPDLILTAPQPYRVGAEGPDVYRNFIFTASFPGTRYVRAVEIRPGAHRIVHHANLLVDRSRSARRREGEDGQPGFPGMDIEIPTSLTDPESHFLFWKPGSRVTPEPEGMAWTLEGGSDLILNVHLKSSGKPEAVQPSIGLYFSKQPPTLHPILVQLENDRALDIPPGAESFLVSDDWTLPVDSQLLGIYPHAHYLGKDVLATATLPGGIEKTLIHIPRWDVTWQAVYRYADPVFLPRGTRIAMRWSYDNSAENPANPSRPPKRVTAGDQTTDEMAHLWLQLLPREPGDGRLLIKESLVRKKLARDPDDFFAHFNLGGILQHQGKDQEAIAEYREAVRIRPEDAIALNALGAVLQLRKETAEAEALYRRALSFRPGDTEAHYNLAGLLLGRGEREEGIAHLRAVLRFAPDDEEARAKLALALDDRSRELVGNGEMGAAVNDFRELTALRPEDSDSWTNLGVALARTGEFAGARDALERALQLNPASEGARKNLEKVRRRLK